MSFFLNLDKNSCSLFCFDFSSFLDVRDSVEIINQSVEALYFTTELHTSSIRARVQPGTKYLYGKKSVGMYVVWLSPSRCSGFTGISRECRDMSWLSSTSGSPVHNTQQ